MRKLLFIGFLLLAIAASHAAVVRLAPEFSFPAAGNKTQSLRSLRGQLALQVPVGLRHILAQRADHGRRIV